MRVVLTLPSDPELLPLVHATTREVAARQGLDEYACERLVLAVGEVATNAMLHGNAGRRDCQVEVCFKAAADRLEVAVADTGHGFDLAAVQRWLSVERRQRLPDEGGRGLLLARACVDELSNAAGEAGHRVLLVKKLRKGGGGSC